MQERNCSVAVCCWAGRHALRVSKYLGDDGSHHYIDEDEEEMVMGDFFHIRRSGHLQLRETDHVGPRDSMFAGFEMDAASLGMTGGFVRRCRCRHLFVDSFFSPLVVAGR